MTNKNNQPFDTIRDGMLKATIWRNDSPRIKGELGIIYNVEFSRTYKDQEGNYQDATSFSGVQLLQLARLANAAYDIIEEALLADWKEKNSPDT